MLPSLPSRAPTALEFFAALVADDRSLNLRYTDVWVRRNGAWQMVAWQSTLLP